MAKSKESFNDGEFLKLLQEILLDLDPDAPRYYYIITYDVFRNQETKRRYLKEGLYEDQGAAAYRRRDKLVDYCVDKRGGIRLSESCYVIRTPYPLSTIWTDVKAIVHPDYDVISVARVTGLLSRGSRAVAVWKKKQSKK